MNFPSELKYTKNDVWVKYIDETSAYIGISDYAQDQLGDLVWVNMPSEGDTVEAGVACCDIESVKSVADVICPVTGEVAELGQDVMDDAGCINEDCYASWILKVVNISATEELMSAEDYKAYREA